MSEKNKERKAHFLLIFVTHPGAFAICKRKQFGNLKVFTNLVIFSQTKTSDLFHLLNLLPEVCLEQQGLQSLLIPVDLAHLNTIINTYASHQSIICYY